MGCAIRSLSNPERCSEGCRQPSVIQKFNPDFPPISSWFGRAHPDGHDFGWTIEPFYEKQVKAAKQDQFLYYVLCLIDMIRLGKPREVNYANEELKKYFNEERTNHNTH